MAIADYRGVKRHFMLALVLTFCTGPLLCATLERLSLDDMIAQSTAVVRGKVTNSYSAFTGRIIYTHYSVQVSEQLKGSARNTIDVAVPGGAANNVRQSFSGAPELQIGQEYVLFLWTGRSGMTQVIGLTQGLFSVAPDSTTDPVATRRASRELMLARGTGQPVKDRTLVMRLSEIRSRIAASAGSAVK